MGKLTTFNILLCLFIATCNCLDKDSEATIQNIIKNYSEHVEKNDIDKFNYVEHKGQFEKRSSEVKTVKSSKEKKLEKERKNSAGDADKKMVLLVTALPCLHQCELNYPEIVESYQKLMCEIGCDITELNDNKEQPIEEIEPKTPKPHKMELEHQDLLKLQPITLDLENVDPLELEKPLFAQRNFGNKYDNVKYTAENSEMSPKYANHFGNNWALPVNSRDQEQSGFSNLFDEIFESTKPRNIFPSFDPLNFEANKQIIPRKPLEELNSLKLVPVKPVKESDDFLLFDKNNLRHLVEEDLFENNDLDENTLQHEFKKFPIINYENFFEPMPKQTKADLDRILKAKKSTVKISEKNLEKQTKGIDLFKFPHVKKHANEMRKDKATEVPNHSEVIEDNPSKAVKQTTTKKPNKKYQAVMGNIMGSKIDITSMFFDENDIETGKLCDHFNHTFSPSIIAISELNDEEIEENKYHEKADQNYEKINNNHEKPDKKEEKTNKNQETSSENAFKKKTQKLKPQNQQKLPAKQNNKLQNDKSPVHNKIMVSIYDVHNMDENEIKNEEKNRQESKNKCREACINKFPDLEKKDACLVGCNLKGTLKLLTADKNFMKIVNPGKLSQKAQSAKIDLEDHPGRFFNVHWTWSNEDYFNKKADLAKPIFELAPEKENFFPHIFPLFPDISTFDKLPKMSDIFQTPKDSFDFASPNNFLENLDIPFDMTPVKFLMRTQKSRKSASKKHHPHVFKGGNVISIYRNTIGTAHPFKKNEKARKKQQQNFPTSEIVDIKIENRPEKMFEEMIKNSLPEKNIKNSVNKEFKIIEEPQVNKNVPQNTLLDDINRKFEELMNTTANKIGIRSERLVQILYPTTFFIVVLIWFLIALRVKNKLTRFRNELVVRASQLECEGVHVENEKKLYVPETTEYDSDKKLLLENEFNNTIGI